MCLSAIVVKYLSVGYVYVYVFPPCYKACLQNMQEALASLASSLVGFMVVS